VKPTFVLLALGSAWLTSCTTLQNRRDLYSPQVVEGPYTRLLAERRWVVAPDASAGLPEQSEEPGSSFKGVDRAQATAQK